MMPVSTTLTYSMAALGMVMAGASVKSTASKFLAPPSIEGYGAYSQPVRAGDTVSIDWTITKRTDCEGTLGRVWRGEGGFYLVESLRNSALPTSDEPREYRIQTLIPALAPEGELDLSIKGVYDCPNGPLPFTLGPVKLNVIGR